MSAMRLECRRGPLDGEERLCPREMLVVGFAPRERRHVALSVKHPSQVATANLSGCYVKETDHLRWEPFA